MTLAKAVQFCCTVAFAVCLSTWAVFADEPLRIGTITVRTNDIFSNDEASSGGFYRIADKIHVETRSSVVRGFLLFKEGDRYEPVRLRETERNLRALPFLRGASVTAAAPHDGLVDVTVTTEDAWSIEPGTTAGSRGGAQAFGAQLSDNNLAGSGRQLSVSFDHGVDRSRAALDFVDPAFLRPYTKARLTYAQNSDGFERRLSIGQPFYSFIAPRSSGLSFDELRRDDRLYQNGLLASQFRVDHRQIAASYGIATNIGDGSANRWTAGVRAVDDRFSTSLVDARSFRYLFLRFNRVNDAFITWNFVDQETRYQDFNLGGQYTLEAAVSPKALGAPRTSEFLASSVSKGARFGANSFVLGSLSFQGRLDRGLQNGIASGSARYVHRFETSVPQIFAAHVLFNQGWHLDRDVQFFADGGSGLRGYRMHAFDGSRNMVINLEQRLSFGRELLHLVSPGIVAFVDVGKATNASLWRPAGFHSDAGIGIRFGLPRSSRSLLRLDFAYALQRDPLGRRGLLVSFASGQAF